MKLLKTKSTLFTFDINVLTTKNAACIVNTIAYLLLNNKYKKCNNNIACVM